ncbi:murein hydrolase activator EnvC family protein [Cellulomonas wangsupingiae]|uniref:M23 family metallopeptidase n=1 Tax=Cellulomonas wangsupingiae TaxID=2968085 RepID=A0ABY5K886_9CELL|nr:M23 family metallopeptidase [Cellulomonas wangsupingiae]MCC2335302.1 M23 family metallopeptidase [Cellulomonas wangsupingiae]UUI66560.1 M23 family metallopeptidase [Cellulomonas wangsupingiae]
MDTSSPAAPRARSRTAGHALRRGAVLALAVALGAPSAAAAPHGGLAPSARDVTVTYRLPLDPPAHLLRPFDPPPRPWLAGHRGVDVAATAGATVVSPAAGVVTFAGDVAGRGVVTVLHADGRRSSLEPLTATVHEGAQVIAGATLGTLAGDAHGGTPGGPALHWGVRVGDRYVDPWLLLPGTGPIVLLPAG